MEASEAYLCLDASSTAYISEHPNQQWKLECRRTQTEEKKNKRKQKAEMTSIPDLIDTDQWKRTRKKSLDSKTERPLSMRCLSSHSFAKIFSLVRAFFLILQYSSLISRHILLSFI